MNLYVLKTWLEARFHVGEDERGANLVEYILLIALIALIVFVSIQFLSGKVSKKFSDAGNSL